MGHEWRGVGVGTRSLLIPPDDLIDQSLGFILHRHDIRPDLLQRPQWLGLVEVPCEADLVSSSDAIRIIPGIRGVGQHLPAEEGLNSALLLQWHLLGVPQFSFWLILHHPRLALDHDLEEAVQWIGHSAGFVDLPDHWRGTLRTLSALFQPLDLRGRTGALVISSLQPQWPLDSHLPVAEGLVGEDLRLLSLLEFEECVADAPDILLRKLAVLLSQVLSKGLEPLCGIDQLHPAPAVLWLAIGYNPDVGGNAGVVEHIQRQGDDGLQPIVLNYPAADIALSLACIAGKERRAIMHFSDAAAKQRFVLHLGEHIHQKHHLPIAGAGDQLEL